MRIIVFVKEVLDPDAVNNYAIAGRLVIGEDGKTLTQTAIPRLMSSVLTHTPRSNSGLRSFRLSATKR